MATVYPTAAGNYSTRTWHNDATGSAYGMVPQPGDTVLANGMTVTVDQDVTVAMLATYAGTTAAAGGAFNATTFPAQVNANTQAGTTRCLYLRNGSVQNGNSIGGTTGVAVGTLVEQGGIQNGNSTGGSVNGAYGTQSQYGGIQHGNSTGGSANGAYGTYLLYGGIQNGNSTGGSVAGAYGTYLLYGSFQNGNSTGGTVAGANGSRVILAGTVISRGITSTSADGILAGSDTTVILDGPSPGDVATAGSRITIVAIGASVNYPFVNRRFRPHHPLFAPSVIG